MVQQVRMSWVREPHDPGSIPGIHVSVEGENVPTMLSSGLHLRAVVCETLLAMSRTAVILTEKLKPSDSAEPTR